MMEEIKGEIKDVNRFVIDVQEELMDALLYLESVKELLKDKL
jgi:hypothetical protein